VTLRALSGACTTTCGRRPTRASRALASTSHIRCAWRLHQRGATGQITLSGSMVGSLSAGMAWHVGGTVALGARVSASPVPCLPELCQAQLDTGVYRCPLQVVYQDSVPVAWYFTSAKDHKVWRKTCLCERYVCASLHVGRPGRMQGPLLGKARACSYAVFRQCVNTCLALPHRFIARNEATSLGLTSMMPCTARPRRRAKKARVLCELCTILWPLRYCFGETPCTVFGEAYHGPLQQPA
jgi:hypothetical protein